MWDFISGIVRTFLVLRDVVGYLVPGTVLLGSIVYAHGFAWAQKSWPGGPEWLGVVAAVIGCYMTGQILVAIGYILYGLYDSATKTKSSGAAGDELLFFRFVYPDLFLDYDRRNTVNILRIGLSIALIADVVLLPQPLNWVAVGLGLLMLLNGYTGQKHVEKFGAATVKAAETALNKKVPFATRK